MKFWIPLLAVLGVVLADEAEDYLEKFGYLNRNAFDGGNVERALRNYQAFAGIPVTGKLDDATKAQMKKKRCGRPDYGDNAFADSKWYKTSLTYKFENYSPDMTQSAIRNVHTKAFNLWSSVTPLKFREDARGRADIKIRWAFGYHGDNSPFDGPGKVLAHAYFPPNGNLHYDEAETFTTGTTSHTNLDWVAVHELGHILGLEHSNVRGAIMYPYYTGYVSNLNLHSDDIRRIQWQYGRGGTGTGTGTGGTCVDRNNQCSYWARIGECDRNPRYMHNYCKKSCRKC